MIAHSSATKIREMNQTACSMFNVYSMDSVGKGKIRSVGGWVISRIKKELKQYIYQNMYSLDAQVEKEWRNLSSS